MKRLTTIIGMLLVILLSFLLISNTEAAQLWPKTQDELCWYYSCDDDVAKVVESHLAAEIEDFSRVIIHVDPLNE